MKNNNRFHVILVLVLGLVSVNGNAALVDRGGGLIYDDVLNITWLQDANYAMTSSYNNDGLMTWVAAMDWAANLSYYDSVRNVTYADWRLPNTNPLNGIAFNETYTFDGSTDFSYNVSAPGTAYAGSTAIEMAHLFFSTLDNKSECDPATSTAIYCSYSQSGWGLTNAGSFTNISSDNYWTSSAEYLSTPDRAWIFSFSHGIQGPSATYDGHHAWAVRDGDVAAIPIPASFWLFGSGLVGMLGFMRRRKS